MRRLLAGACVMACVFYAAGFAFDRHWRTRKGPWTVTFAAASNGGTLLHIQQPRLGVDQALHFSGIEWTQAPVTVAFDQPRMSLPVGRVKHDDLTSLPGVVTLEIFGHEVELLPRTLYLDRRAMGWGQSSNLDIAALDHALPLPEPKAARAKPR